MKQFPPQSAARILTENIPVASPDDNVDKVLNYIRRQTPSFDSINYIYVVSLGNKLKGVLSINSLLKAQPNQKLSEIMTRELVTVHPYTDQEKAAILAIQNNIKAVPVVDKNSMFKGVVSTDKIFSILHQEHIEDILKLSGIDTHILEESEKQTKKTTASLRMRLPWLIIGLLGGILNTWIVSRFNAALEQLLALAFFIPIISYMSGAIANQTLSMLIRNIIIRALNIKKYYINELLSGTFLGASLGLVLSLVSYLWLKSFKISLIIFISMTLNSAVSTTISVIVPWFMVKMKKDPAMASGPFAIVMQDMVSLLVYFSIATLVLSF